MKVAWTRAGAQPGTMTPEQMTEHLRADHQTLVRRVLAPGAEID